MNAKTISTLMQACVLSGVILLVMPSGSSAETAVEALSNAGREMRDAPACNQMASYSEQLANIRSETQEWTRRSSWRRVCIILGQATSVLAEMIAFMRAHVGECNITEAGLIQTAAAAVEMAENRARHCR
jgi:hypothetical protein